MTAFQMFHKFHAPSLSGFQSLIFFNPISKHRCVDPLFLSRTLFELHKPSCFGQEPASGSSSNISGGVTV